jgi:hypothetical protein
MCMFATEESNVIGLLAPMLENLKVRNTEFIQAYTQSKFE